MCPCNILTIVFVSCWNSLCYTRGTFGVILLPRKARRTNRTNSDDADVDSGALRYAIIIPRFLFRRSKWGISPRSDAFETPRPAYMRLCSGPSSVQLQTSRLFFVLSMLSLIAASTFLLIFRASLAIPQVIHPISNSANTSGSSSSPQPIDVFSQTDPLNPPAVDCNVVPDFGQAWASAYQKAQAKVREFNLLVFTGDFCRSFFLVQLLHDEGVNTNLCDAYTFSLVSTECLGSICVDNKRALILLTLSPRTLSPSLTAQLFR